MWPLFRPVAMPVTIVKESARKKEQGTFSGLAIDVLATTLLLTANSILNMEYRTGHTLWQQERYLHLKTMPMFKEAGHGRIPGNK
jgi:hypothetical protein